MLFMQLNSYLGLETLLMHRLVPGLRLQDLQSLAACCRGFQAFVDAFPRYVWLSAAR